MATISPYVPQNPGDLITAEAWNQMQVDIKQDIQASIKTAEDDIKAGTVAKAKDTSTIEGKTPADLTDANDKRYVLRSEQPQKVGAYARYFKQFKFGVTTALLPHKLGAFPIVQLYRLKDVISPGKKPSTDNTDYAGCKFVVFREHQDERPYGLSFTSYHDTALVGIRFVDLMNEIAAPVKPSDSLADAIGDVMETLLAAPNDATIDYAQTKGVADEADKTFQQLDDSGDLKDLYVGLRPELCALGGDGVCQVTIAQANYNWLFIDATNAGLKEGSELTVMLLLRT
jgi:hypothetical protein